MTPVQDDGFHEIQLNGKQVVFLFMAATVVSVVIFLCGVLVGRGVRADHGTMADAAPVNAVAETTPPPQPQPAPAATPAGSDPRAAAPPPAVDDLSYFNRLETKTPPRERLKPSTEKSAPEKTAPEKRTAEKSADKTAADKTAADKTAADKTAADKAAAGKAAADKIAASPERPAAPAPRESPRAPAAAPLAEPASDEPPGSGFAVQIAALNVRGEAEAIAKRLSSKGYAAYVLVPSDGTPAVYRVRIGKFTTRREAETVAAKLKKEEQFNPWVTR